jgi:hypothetical protein
MGLVLFVVKIKPTRSSGVRSSAMVAPRQPSVKAAKGSMAPGIASSFRVFGLRSHSIGAPTQQLPNPRACAESTRFLSRAAAVLDRLGIVRVARDHNHHRRTEKNPVDRRRSTRTAVSNSEPEAETVVDAHGNLHVPDAYRTTYQALRSWAVAADRGKGSKELHVVYASPGTIAALSRERTFC